MAHLCFFVISIPIECHLSLLDDLLMHVIVRVYCIVVDLIAQVKCYHAMLEAGGVGFPCASISYLIALSAG
jgi:hypothetical protein